MAGKRSPENISVRFKNVNDAEDEPTSSVRWNTVTGKPAKDKSKLDTSLRRVRNEGWAKYKSSKTPQGKLIWIMLLLVAVGITIYEVYKAVTDLHNSPIITSYKISTKDEMDLPQIYLCPSMSVRKTYLETNADKVQRAVKLGKFMFVNENMGKLLLDEDSANITDTHSTLLINNITEIYSYSNANNSYEFINNTYMEMGTIQEDLFVYCMFRSFFLSGVLCSNITTAVLDPVYGKCFLIDVGPDRKQLVPAQGLTVILNLKTQEQPDDIKLTPKFSGLAVSVSKKYDLSGSERFLISPGTYAKVDITATHLQFKNIESGPTKQLCNNENDFPFQILTASYSQDSCRMDCYLRTITILCNCLLTIDKVFVKEEITEKYPFCSVEQISKCNAAKKDVSEKAFVEIETCSELCYIACDSWKYDVTVSSMPINEIGLPPLPDNTTPYDLVYIQFAFPHLEYSEFIQDWSMSIDEMIGTIGSHFGLWLGMSIIALLQIPVAIFSLCGFLFHRKSKPVIKEVGRRLTQANVF